MKNLSSDSVHFKILAPAGFISEPYPALLYKLLFYLARDHFWRLVWEQQVPAIIALTKCVEKGRDKCHQ